MVLKILLFYSDRRSEIVDRMLPFSIYNCHEYGTDSYDNRFSNCA